MSVHEDAVRFPDGTEGIYGVIDKEDFALIVPRHDDGRFQLVQQFRYPVGGRYWEFPQGAWETRPGTEPVEVAMGELTEETGLRAASMTRLGYLYGAYGFSAQGFHAFLASGLEAGQACRDREEQDMLTAAFSLEQIHQMIRSGEIRDAASIAVLGLLAIPEPQ